MICEKEGFKKPKDAKDRLTSLRQRKGMRHTYALYKCQFCGLYHVTTKTKINRKEKGEYKYPVYVDDKKPAKKFTPPPIPKKLKPNPEKLSTDKIMTKEQAQLLKKLVNANKYDLK